MLWRRTVVFALALLLCCSLFLCLKNVLLTQTLRVVSLPSPLGTTPSSNDTRGLFALTEPSPESLLSTLALAPPEPIVLAFVFIGSSAAHEGIIAIKSALIHTSRSLEIHIICTEDTVPIVEPPLQLVTRPYYDLNVTLHIITRERVQERLFRAGLNQDPGFLTKMLIHELLVGVEKAVFVDTDMIFVIDPAQLWDTFDMLDEQTMITLPTLGPTSHAGDICTCVMLLHLERMRNPSRSPSSSFSTPATLLVPTPHHPSILAPVISEAVRTGIPSWIGGIPRGTLVPFDPTAPPFGDQGIVWVLWNAKPELFARLGQRWDVTHCRGGYGVKLVLGKGDGHDAGEDETMMTEEEHIRSQAQTNGDELVVPGILHFNCQSEAGSNVWAWPQNHESKTQTWAPMIIIVVRYKWVWLNRGTPSRSGHTRVSKKLGVRWLDEGEDVPAH